MVHDKFHVVKYLTNAIDLTRREEVKTEPLLKKTRFVFLKRLDTMTDKQRLTFEIENISSTDQIVSVYDFKCYSDDVASSAYYYGDNGLSTTTLSSGRKATGNVYFEVPQNANSIDVEYETNYWSGNKAIFVVK